MIFLVLDDKDVSIIIIVNPTNTIGCSNLMRVDNNKLKKYHMQIYYKLSCYRVRFKWHGNKETSPLFKSTMDVDRWS